MDDSPWKKLLTPAILLLAFIFAGFTGEDVLQQFGLAAIEQAQQLFSYVLQIGLWISAAFFINRTICVLFWDGLVSRAIKGEIPRLLKDMTFFIVYAIAGTGIMAVVFEKPVTGFWATSGVLGIVLGFALRNIILDLFTGLAVNVDRPYAIGDWIMIVDNPGSNENLVGCVQEINWRTTRLKTTDNNMLIIPNSVMGQKVITNFMSPGEQSRFEIDFTLDFSIPTERAIRILNASVKAVADEKEGPLADPAPKTRITGINELGVQYRVRYWIIPRLVSPAKARNTVIQSVLSHLHQAGISLAYPKQDTYVASMPKREYKVDNTEDAKELLSRIPWMKALSDDELQSLAEKLIPKRIPSGELLGKQDDGANSMFLIIEGLAEMYSRPEPGSEDVAVGKLKPGDFIDEMSVLIGEDRKSTIKSATDLLVYEIGKKDLSPIIANRPEISDAIADIITLKRKDISEKLIEHEIAKNSVEDRVTLGGRIKKFFLSFLRD